MNWRVVVRGVLLAMVFAICGTAEGVAQCKSDRELLRAAHSTEAREEPRAIPYGIEPNRQTLSPLYHATSSALWVWEQYVAPEVCAPGGYSDSNTNYFKSLWREYGPLLAIPMGFDRMVRNTKIGRATTPSNERGLIDDDPKRYRQ